MFIAARGMIGFDIALNFTSAPLLFMELAFPTQKSSLVGFFNAQWSELYFSLSAYDSRANVDF